MIHVSDTAFTWYGMSAMLLHLPGLNLIIGAPYGILDYHIEAETKWG